VKEIEKPTRRPKTKETAGVDNRANRIRRSHGRRREGSRETRRRETVGAKGRCKGKVKKVRMLMKGSRKRSRNKVRRGKGAKPVT
jgi:hypothetical protein